MCDCVCVCVREREGGRERENEHRHSVANTDTTTSRRVTTQPQSFDEVNMVSDDCLLSQYVHTGVYPLATFKAKKLTGMSFTA